MRIDNSEAQLESVKRFQREFRLEFPLLHGSAEEVPFRDETFDLAISASAAALGRGVLQQLAQLALD